MDERLGIGPAEWPPVAGPAGIQETKATLPAGRR
jgi:hypothetical protein